MAFAYQKEGASAFGSSAFGGQMVAAAPVQANGQSQTGPDLIEILTEGLGFHAINGEAKLRLLPTPWPSNALPSPTSSLLSIASGRGLLAAAGPETVVIVSTDAVRKAFLQVGSSDFKSFTPQLCLPIGTRISQVAFSADESCLVISAEIGGGLAVYDVNALMQGSTKSAFELSTDGAALRALVPNPMTDRAELFALITTSGDLMVANFKTRQFLNGPSGQVLKNGVSCLSWSAKGKQLVAGLANGSAVQMTPEGEIKAHIPKPLNLEGDHYVSSIIWLENKVFLVAHTPTSFDSNSPPPTTYHIITQTQTNSTFQKLPEVSSPFGLNRSPPFQFLQRLRDFPPDLQDVLIVASTASEDIGMFTRSKKPLASEPAAETITGVFTSTGMANDSRRAAVPMTEDMSSVTSPIGAALDLSSKDKVSRPLPGEEMDFSDGPLPAYFVLNNDGVLMGWWIVYADSIRGHTTYPGLKVTEASQAPQTSRPLPSAFAAAKPFGSTNGQQSSAFGVSSFSSIPAAVSGSTPSTNVPKVSTSIFGASPASTTTPVMGVANPFAPASLKFGVSSLASTTSGSVALQTGSAQNPPWGSMAIQGTGASTFRVSAFGKPCFPGVKSAFGAPSTLLAQGSSFGTPSALGSQLPPLSSASKTGEAMLSATRGLAVNSSSWGQSSTASTSAFGQPSMVGMRTTSAFGTPAPVSTLTAPTISTSTVPSGGGFASFASQGGFAAAASKTTGTSVLTAATPGQSFASSTMDIGSSFGVPSLPSESPARNPFGKQDGFVPGSNRKNLNARKSEEPAEHSTAGGSFFGADFGGALSSVPELAFSPMIKEESMEAEAEVQEVAPTESVKEETNASTEAPAFTSSFKLPQPTEGALEPPAAINSSPPSAHSVATTSILDTPKASGESLPFIKPEPEDSPSGVDRNIPATPLPPDSTSKASFTPGTSSSSSMIDPPQPPDTTPKAFALDPSFMTFLPQLVPPTDSNTLVNDQETAIMTPVTTRQPEHLTTPDFKQIKEESFDDEGSGVDVGQDGSPSTDRSLHVSPEESFKGQQGDALPGGKFTNISKKPATQLPTSIFSGIPREKAPMPYFPTPDISQLSPRSPSPVRAMLYVDEQRPDLSRSASAQGLSTKAPVVRQGNKGRSVRSAMASSRYREEKAHEQEAARSAALESRRNAEKTQDLSDDEDERVRKELKSEIEPCLTLGPWLSRQDYTGETMKTGLPASIERLFRDINSMLDTLGLNARTLAAFTKGQEVFRAEERELSDFEEETPDVPWCLTEVPVLRQFEDHIHSELEALGAHDFSQQIHACRDLLLAMTKLKSRFAEVRRLADTKVQATQLDAVRSHPLSAEQSALRYDLRRAFSTAQSQIANAEDKLSMLRAKLAAHDRSGKHKAPTVEAVERTIRKMTGIVQQRNGDIDVLESQARKLGLGLAALSLADRSNVDVVVDADADAAADAEVNSDHDRPSSSSAFVTPPTSTKKIKMLASGGSVAFHTPKGVKPSMRTSMRTSIKGTTPSRLGRELVLADELRSPGVKARRKEEICGLLKSAVLKRGLKVRSLDT